MPEPVREPLPEARSRAQRERILIAAQTCFVRHGFHAATMSKIAETAGMSPGLIYRYFDGKSAIILAIIERQLEVARADIAALDADTDLVPLFERLFDAWRTGESCCPSPALLLEMTAEATRDPAIARALAEADRVTGAALLEWLEQTRRNGARVDGEDVVDLEARAFLLRCLLGGLAIRAIREPGLDAEVLRRALRLVLEAPAASAPPAETPADCRYGALPNDQ
ncbi:MAG TPA: TetR/AcrR family transcriptional regulator [Woeseiaceae bacterium]|nr:TetR/AcrR family transcriptional regulator [Woeseiaceae bacterium]